MKKFLTLIAAAICLAGPAVADPVAGNWRSQPGETGGYIHVRIAPCSSGICGVITQVVDNENTSIVGRPIIWDMQADGNGRYSGGQIWAPDRDKVYKSKMTLLGANQLKVEGCVAVICRSQTWTRLN